MPYVPKWFGVFAIFSVCAAVVGGAALTSTSVKSTRPTSPYRTELHQYRCDNSNSIPGTDAFGGETCAAGDWWPAVDAHGAKVVTLSGKEYGTGAGQWSLFNCEDPVGSGTNELPTVSRPGIEDPNSAPTPADPDPLCTRINVDASGATIPLDGVGTQEIHFSGQGRTFAHLVVRTDVCTGECDASLALEVAW